MEFRFDTGSGPAILRTAEKIPTGKWLDVSIERKLRNGVLTVGDEVIKGESPGSTRGLNIRTPIYFGGLNRDKLTLAPGVGIADNGFMGCLADLRIGGKAKVRLYG